MRFSQNRHFDAASLAPGPPWALLLSKIAAAPTTELSRIDNMHNLITAFMLVTADANSANLTEILLEQPETQLNIITTTEYFA